MPGEATTCLNKQDSKAKCLMYYARCKQLTFDKVLVENYQRTCFILFLLSF